MTEHKILHYPDPRLRQKGRRIADITPEIQTLIDEMFADMYKAEGCGLAATQIGIDLQLAVIDVSKDRSQPLVLINPEIIELGKLEKTQEACLSVPHYWDTIQRAPWAKIRATDREGKIFEMAAEGVLAQAFQHEIDHLNGKLYVDRLSDIRKTRFKKKYQQVHHQCDDC